MKAMALVLAISATTVACTKKEPPAGSAEPPAAAKGGPLVTKFRIGPLSDRDGTVTRETDSFQRGEAVHVSFEVKNVPRGSTIRVVWSDSSRRMIAEEEKPLPSDGAVSFEMKDAGSLPEGDYVVEFFRAEPAAARAWRFLGTKPFKVGPKRSP